MPVNSRSIAIGIDGETFEGRLLAEPREGIPAACVLVAHTIRGRTEFEEEKAQALAGLGYAAIAVDLFGEQARGADKARLRQLMTALREDREMLRRRLLAWLDAARAAPEVDPRRIAAIGFCFGGLCALDLARSGADIAGVVSFHGLLDGAPDLPAAPVRARVLVLHGWDDPLATPDDVLALAGELTANGADWQIHAYGNTLHAFTNPAAADHGAGTVYNADADRRSWTAMRNFLHELFGEQPVA